MHRHTPGTHWHFREQESGSDDTWALLKISCWSLLHCKTTPGGKASCFPRSAWDLLLMSFNCSPKMFLSRRISLPSPRFRKRPVCDPPMPMGGSLPAPPSACMKLCFMSLRALKEGRMGMSDYKSPRRRSTWLSRHPQSYTHTLLAWYQCQEKQPLAA